MLYLNSSSWKATALKEAYMGIFMFIDSIQVLLWKCINIFSSESCKVSIKQVDKMPLDGLLVSIWNVIFEYATANKYM